MRIFKPAFALLIAACGTDGSVTPEPDAALGMTNLITSSWSLAPGTEMYQCTRFTVTHDMYISEIRPTAPQGTHHTVLSLAQGSGVPDSTYTCTDPFEFGNLGIIYGSGLGSVPFVFPPGIGMKITAGQQVHINLHLFNAGDSTLTGTSGIDVKEVAQADVQHEARTAIWGQQTINLAAGTSTVTGACTVGSPVTVIALQPHMHQLGTHFKMTETPSGGTESTLYDETYGFDAQVHRMVTPFLSLAAGDHLSVACTYNNTTGGPVTFGESTRDEMCFAGTWYYPASTRLCP
jgi:Copper type II ascorbate-dependent monooxygenase, C-terminal domain